MRIKKLGRISAAVACVFLLSAFRHTDIEGHTDPHYAGYQFSTVVLQMPNLTLSYRNMLEERLAKKLRKMDIRLLTHNDLFPPTRTWTEEDIREVYESNGVDAGIIITLGNHSSSRTPGMVMYDATTINGMTFGSATQVSFTRDQATFAIALVDAKTQDTVWMGELETRGSGTLFTGGKSTIKGLVKGLVKEWKSAGFLGR